MCIESVMLSNHLIFSRPLLLLPSDLPSIKVFSNESVLHIRWPQSIVTSASESFLPMNIQGLFLWGLTYIYLPGGSVVKNPPTNAGDTGSTSASGRGPGEGNSYPPQDCCLENSMDRGTWQATVHGVTKNQAWLSNWSQTHTHVFCKICISWKKEKTCLLHDYWGDGSYLHPTWQRRKGGHVGGVKIQAKVFFKVRSTLLQLICQRTHGNWLQEIQELVEKKKRLFISRSC